VAGVVELRVLGPLEVRCGGAALPLFGRKQQLVLALLAVNAGRAVSLDELVDEVWPDGPPASAVANVRAYAANIRRMLQSSITDGANRLVRKGSGYVLRASQDELDLLTFSARVAAGRDALRRDDVPAAAAAFAEALVCWRGSVLAGLPRGPLLAVHCAAIEEERAVVVEQLAEAYLALAEPGRSAALLREHVHKNPLRERAYGLLMRSLYQGGDVAGAVAVYAQARAALAEELGVEPGRELRDLHRSILNRDGSLEDGGAPQRAAVPPVVPAQLPAALAAFVGREDSLKQLDSLLAGDAPPAAVVISAIAGTAGIGKTALAVRWAHSVADRFPDGQLYVNLRGFDPSGSAMSPAEAVRGFLDALEVPPQRIPASFDAQVGLYRSLLAGRRMLVLLDNARDADQVRPLLPGSPGCLVLVTSRNQLSGLVAAEGAQPLALDVLSTAESGDLLASRLGRDRVAAQPGAVDEIVARCARLPLALAVVAARAALRPDLPLAELAAGLREAAGGLDAFADTDPATDIRCVFSWSYRTLTDDAARLFRLLGLHAGPDITAPAVASLVGRPRRHAQVMLAELARAHLIIEHTAGRYGMHDLLRAYATELAHGNDSDADRRASVGRILDHYLHTAHRGALLLYPRRHPIALAPASSGVTPEHLADHRQATAWFSAEHPVLLAAVEMAANTGFESPAWQLAWTLWDFLDRRGHWQDLAIVQRTALAAANRLGDQAGQAHSQHGLGFAHYLLGDYDAAGQELHQAYELFGALGDHTGQANVELTRCAGVADAGDLQAALHHARQAHDLFRAADHRFGQAGALNNIGLLSAELGDHRPALEHCLRALALYEEVDDRHGQAMTWDSLGSIQHHLGDHAEAVACYRRALNIFEDLGDRHEEAETLANLGDTHLALGEVDAARDVWHRALDIFGELGHPDADQTRTKLQQLD
jgi:DNA-binding SARP family transcriptional activator